MLIMPLAQMLIFNFVLGVLFKVKLKNYPLLLLSGLSAWSFLRFSLDQAASSILANANLIKKTYFPREILPISAIITCLISFIFSLVILSIFSLFSGVPLFPNIFWLLLVIFIQIILILGISLLLSGLNVIYQDTQFIKDILLSIWFYLTPIVYSLETAKSALPKKLFMLYGLNPMSGIISAYQQIFVYGHAPDLRLIVSAILISLIIFIIGCLCFSKYEDIFADLI